MFDPCLKPVRDGLLSVKYRKDRLIEHVPVSSDASRSIGLVAYAGQPFDARTSAVAAVDGRLFDEGSLALLKPLGVPVIAQCHSDHAIFWKQTPDRFSFIDRVPAGKIASFFRAHQQKLSPEAIFRAKVWGRMDSSWQLNFVDAGLLPLVEQTAGEDLRRLLERAVTATKAKLGWRNDISDVDGKWLLKSVFWLLAVKILQDKGVPGFVRLDLADLESVYLKLAKHYNKHDPRPVQIDGSQRRDALLVAAEMIQSFGHCGAVTTESLAWVYESALIDRATRQQLGTHSTPTWLVDEIVAKLRPWIEEMPVDDRRVFEPACGHAGFLISAMRLLSELLPANRTDERKVYLRKRLRGIEVDSFAYEVAKLSLTLADVPNDNGWMLDNSDMFVGDTLRSAVSEATIVLANPPFEPFGDVRPDGAMHSRADETFRQIVEALPHNGVFGVVMPQTILHSTQGSDLRRRLLAEYEISEITLFADKVFNHGQPETAVILGRRVGSAKNGTSVSYRRVREDQVKAYAKTLKPSSTEQFSPSVFTKLGDSLLVPELADVWRLLEDRPKLKRLAEGGQGFQHKGEKDPSLPLGVVRESDVRLPGLVEGFAGWTEDQLTHGLPKTKWLNLDKSVISRPRHGTVSNRRQILLNYHPVSRGPWRLKALIDSKGHPVTSDFNVLRPTTKETSCHILWAILNSPVGSAFAYAHSSKRDVLVGDMREMPVIQLDATSAESLHMAIDAYLEAAKGTKALVKTSTSKASRADDQMSLRLPLAPKDERAAEEELKFLHWRIDAEVLRLYDLPAGMERRILDLFTGEQRRGVPFVQTEYFPKGFNQLDRLSDLLAITADWEKTNRRRCDLIRKDVKGKLTDKENQELQRLEHLADARIAYMELLHPEPADEVQKTVERLKREGKWVE